MNVNTNDYQLGYQSGMVALQRELSLRNRDIIISKPQEEKDKIEASTSTPEGNQEQIQANPRIGKGKGIVVDLPKRIKQKSPDKQAVNEEQQQNKPSPQEQKNPKEEYRASTSSDPKFDSLVKVMERLVDKLSIRDKPPARDNVPQIRNPNSRGPRQQDPNPPRIVQR